MTDHKPSELATRIMARIIGFDVLAHDKHYRDYVAKTIHE